MRIMGRMIPVKTDDIKKKWNDLRGSCGVTQRIDPHHPLNFFVGIGQNSCDELVLITSCKPLQIISSKALEVITNLRADKKWATQIYSIDENNQDIFARLCVDLVECSKNAKDEKEGIRIVEKRYMAWYKLFSSINDNLSISVLKGLLGELNFAKSLIDKGVNVDSVINAWQGPDGADKDFILGEMWYEIKTITTGKDKVTISSLNQLEANNSGYLIVYSIDKTNKEDSNAKSVKEYIDDFRKILEVSPNALDIFERKLNFLGYIDKRAYEDMYFVFGIEQVFEVNYTFPRIVTENVPPEIIGAQYDLSISGIARWKVEDFRYGIK